jgi:hypothetical protein
MARKLFVAFFLIISSIVSAQQPTVKILTSGKRVSFRGLSVVSDEVVWASGSSGTVVRSVDGGTNWEWITVPGYEKRDFRDIEAFDKDTAVIIAVAAPAVILKTSDGGKNWKKVFEDTTNGTFMDAMDFGYRYGGYVIGDPLDGKSVYMVHTNDHGDTWERMTDTWVGSVGLTVSEGEAFFASSGTNIKMLGNHPLIVSGGKTSRIYWGIKWFPLPIMQGKESTGANSVAVSPDHKKGIVVGGDFTRDSVGYDNSVLFDIDRELTKMRSPSTPPHGYRSCVIYLSKKKLLTCGTSGVDISKDGGNNWQLISRESFHVCQKAKKGNAVFLAGGGGRIAKLEY